MKKSTWQLSKLGDVTGKNGVFIDGDWVESKDQDPNGDVRLMQLADIGVGEFLSRSSRFMTSKKAAELNCTFLEPGDILIARMPDPIGRACIFPGNPQPCVTVVDVCIVRLDPDCIHNRWLMWILNSPHFQQQLTPYISGTTRQRISRRNLQSLELKIPPLEEQQRIAAILDKADAVRRKRQSAIALTEELLRSAFLETMEQWSSKCRAVNLKQTTLSERNSFVNGPFGSNLLTAELQNEGVPVVYIRDIRDGIYRRVSKSYVSQAKAKELNTCNVKPGDVLIAKVGDPPGIAAVYPNFESDAIVTQDVIRMRIDRKVTTPEFIASYLNSSLGKHSLKGITVEATRSRFPLGDFKNVIIKLPPIEAQEQFSQVVIQARIAQSRIIKKSFIEDDLFNSLLQRAFRGEL